jgi:copper homeostasis protein CutC
MGSLANIANLLDILGQRPVATPPYIPESTGVPSLLDMLSQVLGQRPQIIPLTPPFNPNIPVPAPQTLGLGFPLPAPTTTPTATSRGVTSGNRGGSGLLFDILQALGAAGMASGLPGLEAAGAGLGTLGGAVAQRRRGQALGQVVAERPELIHDPALMERIAILAQSGVPIENIATMISGAGTTEPIARAQARQSAQTKLQAGQTPESLTPLERQAIGMTPVPTGEELLPKEKRIAAAEVAAQIKPSADVVEKIKFENDKLTKILKQDKDTRDWENQRAFLERKMELLQDQYKMAQAQGNLAQSKAIIEMQRRELEWQRVITESMAENTALKIQIKYGSGLTPKDYEKLNKQAKHQAYLSTVQQMPEANVYFDKQGNLSTAGIKKVDPEEMNKVWSLYNSNYNQILQSLVPKPTQTGGVVSPFPPQMVTPGIAPPVPAPTIKPQAEPGTESIGESIPRQIGKVTKQTLQFPTTAIQSAKEFVGETVPKTVQEIVSGFRQPLNVVQASEQIKMQLESDPNWKNKSVVQKKTEMKKRLINMGFKEGIDFTK